jgi:hypothetical protein
MTVKQIILAPLKAQLPPPDVSKSMQHELWSCKMQYETFHFYKTYLTTHGRDPHWKALIFTAYGNFLRHLYSFYEASIKKMNKDLLDRTKTEQKMDTSDAINYLLSQEVCKLIRNRRLAIESEDVEFVETMPGLDENNVDKEFGFHLCQIRHYFSHTYDSRRLKDNPVSLSRFYKKYQHFAHLLFESPLLAWDSPKGLNNPEIDRFIEELH